MHVTLPLMIDGDLAEGKEMSLLPRETVSVVFNIPHPDEGRHEVSLGKRANSSAHPSSSIGL